MENITASFVPSSGGLHNEEGLKGLHIPIFWSPLLNISKKCYNGLVNLSQPSIAFCIENSNWFAPQIKWLVFIWNAMLELNGLGPLWHFLRHYDKTNIGPKFSFCGNALREHGRKCLDQIKTISCFGHVLS